MTQHQTIINYLRELRLQDEQYGNMRGGFRKKHELLNNKDDVFITLRGADRTLRDLVEQGYLERRMDGRFAEYRYIPHEYQEPRKLSEQEMLIEALR